MSTCVRHMFFSLYPPHFIFLCDGGLEFSWSYLKYANPSTAAAVLGCYLNIRRVPV